MYIYTEADNEIIGDSTNIQFFELLKTKWDRIHEENDVFRYKINQLEEKMVDKYFIQLNPDRAVKRRAPEQIDNILQPFDKNKFNFTKVNTKEILFNMTNGTEVHSILVNVSPISKHHSLLCPSVSKCHPQVITEESLKVALDVWFLAQTRDLRIGFNSLCALASVNHLHLHLFFESHTLAVENVKCRHIKGPLFTIEDYPAPAFCFHVQNQETIAEISHEVYKLVSYFTNKSIAHNLMITRGEVPGNDDIEGVRIIVWPRKSNSGAKQYVAFNIAVLELSGWFPIYDESFYEDLRPEVLEYELKKWAFDDFDVLCEEVQKLY